MDMDFVQQLEYPLPVLETYVEKLVTEVSILGYEGIIKVYNSGGGMLCGNVMSNSPFIKFSKEEFKGNKVNLNYKIALDVYNNGDIIQETIVILSNGGEKIIPVLIKIVPHVINTHEGVAISTLEDFMDYVKKYPLQGRILFVSNEFTHWLINFGFDFIEIYERLILDPNKERAIENFFILNKLKNPINIETEEKSKQFYVLENSSEIIKGSVAIKKLGWGYVSSKIETRYKSNWLKIYPYEITGSNFDKDDTSIINYEIDPVKISKKQVTDQILIWKNVEIPIKVTIIPLYNIVLEKEFFKHNEKGKILIENKSKREIIVEIIPFDSFLKFEGKRYIINNSSYISFDVKISTLQSAQMAVKKQPVITSQINVKIIDKENEVFKKLYITIGDFA